MNKRFKDYLERFCSAHKLSCKAAEKYAVVMEVKKYYEDESKFSLTRE